jgi:hypothetical protein
VGTHGKLLFAEPPFLLRSYQDINSRHALPSPAASYPEAGCDSNGEQSQMEVPRPKETELKKVLQWKSSSTLQGETEQVGVMVTGYNFGGYWSAVTDFRRVSRVIPKHFGTKVGTVQEGILPSIFAHPTFFIIFSWDTIIPSHKFNSKIYHLFYSIHSKVPCNIYSIQWISYYHYHLFRVINSTIQRNTYSIW